MKKIVNSYLPTLEVGDQRKKNPKILRIILSEKHTRIDFGYVAPWIYERGGWIRIAPYTFVQVHGSDKRYALIEAQNIPIAPEQLNFESTEDWKVFTLFFEPLPLKDCTIDLIEEEKPEDTDFNFYGIKLTKITETEIIHD